MTSNQKPNTGFRIGVSVAMIIMMLGVVISLDVLTTYSITNTTKKITEINNPISKSLSDVSNMQTNQRTIMHSATMFYSTSDTSTYNMLKDQFYSYSDMSELQLQQIENDFSESSYTTPDPQMNSWTSSINDIKNLNLEYNQIGQQIFNSIEMKKSNINQLVSTFDNNAIKIHVMESNLLEKIDKSTQEYENYIDTSKEKALTLEITIMVTAGIISIASGYFVNQINRDLVNEVIRNTQSLQKAKEKLEKLNVLKDDFISMASHELKSPLNPIYGFVELAQNGDIGKEEALSGIAKQARQIEEVANKMLDIGRIDNNKLHLTVERFNLSNLILEITDSSRANLGSNIQIVAKMPKNLEVEADRIRIGQVIRNLVNNALKFTAEGTIIIDADANYAKNLVEVTVRDSGSGIHQDVLPNLFNKFVTSGPKQEKLGGTGLGLYLCKGIIESHGGTMSANNNEVKGATFGFKIPINRQIKTSNVSDNITN